MPRLPDWLPQDDEKFLVQVGTLAGWLQLADARNLRLPLPDHPRLHEAWVRCLYVPTPRDLRLAKSVGITQARSGGTQRRWLGVDGPTDLGKTDLAVNFGIRMTNLDNGNIRYRDGRHRHLPVLYVEADTKQDGIGLLRSMCAFAELPDSGTDDQLWSRLRDELPLMGTTVVIIDDAHMLKRTRSSSTTLTNNLRKMLRLPVTYVYIGAGLRSSALLRKGPGDEFASAFQLRKRSEKLDLLPMQLPRDKSEYEDMLKKFGGKVVAGIPGVKFSGLQSGPVREEIFKQADGGHGSIFCVLKDATCYALTDGSRDVTASVFDRFLAPDPDEPHPIDPDEWPDEMATYDVG